MYYFIQNRVIDVPQDMLKDKFPAKEWRHHPEFPGGIFYDTAVHDIAALQHIFGAVQKSMPSAWTTMPSSPVRWSCRANLTFPNNITGQFSFFCAGKEMQRPLIGLRIFGTEGMIYLEERDCGTVNVAYNDGSSEQIPYKPQMGYYHELVNFHKVVTGEEQPSVTPELTYGDAMVIFAMLDPIAENKGDRCDQTGTLQAGFGVAYGRSVRACGAAGPLKRVRVPASRHLVRRCIRAGNPLPHATKFPAPVDVVAGPRDARGRCDVPSPCGVERARTEDVARLDGRRHGGGVGLRHVPARRRRGNRVGGFNVNNAMVGPPIMLRCSWAR